MKGASLDLLTVEHADALFRCVEPARADLTRWFEWPDRVTSPQAAEAYILEVQRCSRIKLWWLIYGDSQPVGGVQLRLRDGGASVSLPYWLMPEARGKGVATAAVRACLKKAAVLGFSTAKFDIA